MMKIVIAKTAAKARKRIAEIDNLANLGQWEKAAICYAYGMKQYNKIGDMRAADKAAADELNAPGYSDYSVRQYRLRWRNAGMPDVRPGDEAELPDFEWDSIQGGSNKSQTPDRIAARAEKDPAYAAEVVAGIIAAVPAVVTEAFTPAPKPTMKDRRGGEPMETAELIASAGKLWRHTIDQAIAESEDLDSETADYLRETRRYMKMAEKAITGKRFRI